MYVCYFIYCHDVYVYVYYFIYCLALYVHVCTCKFVTSFTNLQSVIYHVIKY